MAFSPAERRLRRWRPPKKGFKRQRMSRFPPPAALAGWRLRCRAGAAGRQECGALGVGRARTHWASPYSLGEPSNEVGRASTKGPSNKVGASHQTRLGEPVLRGRWASQLGEPVLIGRASWASPYSLGEPLNHFHSGQRLPLLGAVPARRCACSARLVKCLLGAASACSARSVPTSARSARLVKCPLGTVPARHV